MLIRIEASNVCLLLLVSLLLFYFALRCFWLRCFFSSFIYLFISVWDLAVNLQGIHSLNVTTATGSSLSSEYTRIHVCVSSLALFAMLFPLLSLTHSLSPRRRRKHINWRCMNKCDERTLDCYFQLLSFLSAFFVVLFHFLPTDNFRQIELERLTNWLFLRWCVRACVRIMFFRHLLDGLTVKCVIDI